MFKSRQKRQSSAFSFPLFEALLCSGTFLLKARLRFLTFRFERFVLIFPPAKCFVPVKFLFPTKFLFAITGSLPSKCLSTRLHFPSKWFLPVPGFLPPFSCFVSALLSSWTVSLW